MKKIKELETEIRNTKLRPRLSSKKLDILHAIESLNRSMQQPDPNISVNIQYGVDTGKEGKEFVAAMKAFIQAYKKYFNMEQIEVDLFLS
jgi:hypothetical protein